MIKYKTNIDCRSFNTNILHLIVGSSDCFINLPHNLPYFNFYSLSSFIPLESIDPKVYDFLVQNKLVQISSSPSNNQIAPEIQFIKCFLTDDSEIQNINRKYSEINFQTINKTNFEICFKDKYNSLDDKKSMQILIVDSYSDPILDIINFENLKLSRPWIVAVKLSQGIFIGPKFNYTNGCWTCFKKRLDSLKIPRLGSRFEHMKLTSEGCQNSLASNLEFGQLEMEILKDYLLNTNFLNFNVVYFNSVWLQMGVHPFTAFPNCETCQI